MALRMPMWANPLAPPPLRVTPILGLDAGGVGCASTKTDHSRRIQVTQCFMDTWGCDVIYNDDRIYYKIKAVPFNWNSFI